MKKRIVCALLTLIMLVGLVPVTASAATLSTSAAAITVLKQMTKFTSECYHVSGSEFRTGYGTVCEEKHYFDNKGEPKTEEVLKADSKTNVHTITQKQADTALRAYLKELDTKINKFASSNNLTLTQNQHDALVVFTYGVGESWMNGTGVVKDAIVKGADANTLLNAMSLWGDMNRRKVEVNMYMNGIYSNTIPSSYSSVTYNANGGSIPQENNPDGSYTMYFDASQTVSHIGDPTRNGYTFLGWYTDKKQGTWMPQLNDDCEGITLYAHWQKKGLTVQTVQSAVMLATGTGENASYTLSASSLASSNMYSEPRVRDGSLYGKRKAEDDFAVTFDYIDPDGNRWAYGKNKEGYDGWVRVGTRKSVTTEGTEVDFEVTVTVTNSFVNRRVNATAASAKNGSYSQGTQVLIIKEKNGFGQVGVKDEDGVVKAVGWIALMYTNWNDVKDGAVTDGSNNKTVIATATVTFNGYLNIRAEAGTDGKFVGALAKNDTVNVYQIKTVNGHQWGRISSGWICLTYTKVTMLTSQSISDEGALSYAFTGTVKNAPMDAHVSAGENTNLVSYTDAQKNTYYSIPKDTAVTLTNLVVVNGTTWAKATWKNPEKDEDNKDIKVTRTGWVPVSESEIMAVGLAAVATIELDPVKYTVVATSINARDGYGDENELVFSLNKGVEVEVNRIVLYKENIWGYITAINLAESGKTEKKEGWINLASKYVKRSSEVTIEDDDSKDTGLIATVINTDSLKVRKTGASYGAQIGTLAGGSTVRVWEKNDKGWYKVDSNQNGTYDYEGDGWVSGTYLDVRTGTLDDEKTVTDVNGNSYTTDGTGKGIVANTYAGVNVRTGAGTGYGSLGKLLPGTAVDILEVKTVGASKWGRTEKGWICMDYVTMITYNESQTPDDPAKGTSVGSLDDVDKTTTTAIYTGHTVEDNTVFAEADLNSTKVRTAYEGENITVQELAKVTQKVKSDSVTTADGTQVTTTTTTTYWARINDGWINLTAGVECIALDALDEKVHTLTGSETLNVRKEPTTSSDSIAKLKKGDQVAVTALAIENDKVWGRIEIDEGTGWIRLDYMSEGAYYVKESTTNNTTGTTSGTNSVTIGNGSSTGGFVTNTSGYRYTGKVINTNELRVRATASTGASEVTTLKKGAALVIYETTIAENMAWGRCDAGWVYLYYVDLTPVTGALDARVVYNDNTIIYTDTNCSTVAGTYARMTVIDIYEIVGKMARTDLGWVNTDNLLS